MPKSGEPLFDDRTHLEGRRDKAFKLRPTDLPPVLNFKRKLRREAAHWLQQSLPGGGGLPSPATLLLDARLDPRHTAPGSPHPD